MGKRKRFYLQADTLADLKGSGRLSCRSGALRVTRRRTLKEFGQKLEDFGLIVGVIVIAAMLIPLAVIAVPLLLLGIMALRVLVERYPRIERVLRQLRKLKRF